MAFLRRILFLSRSSAGVLGLEEAELEEDCARAGDEDRRRSEEDDEDAGRGLGPFSTCRTWRGGEVKEEEQSPAKR